MVLSTPVTISPDQEFSHSAGALEGRPVVLVVEDEVLVRIVQVDEFRMSDLGPKAERQLSSWKLWKAAARWASSGRSIPVCPAR